MSAPHPTSEQEWSIGRLISWTADYLAGCKVDDARLSCEVLLAHSAGCRRIDLYARFDQPLSDDQREAFRGLVKRAARHEPIAYLVGEKEFFSMRFEVTPDVLIPRGETETLVECVLDHLTQMDVTTPRLLDIGTGSGCVAIAILKHSTAASGVATDISEKAIQVAVGNAKRYDLCDRLRFAKADCLDIPAEYLPGDGFDVIVSNPPYIPVSEMDTLDETVRENEPRIALTDENDGLSFYRAISTGAADLLAPGGIVAVEIADDSQDAVRKAVEASGELSLTRTIKDRVVGKPRVLVFSNAAARVN